MNLVKNFLKQREWTQAEFARNLGGRTTRFQVSDWLRRKKRPGIVSLQRIAKVTGFTLEELANDLRPRARRIK